MLKTAKVIIGNKVVHKGFGWKPQKPDFRDLKYRPKQLGVFPSLVDLRKGTPNCYDQAQLGSCVGNGCAFVAQYRLIQEKKPYEINVNLPSAIPSRLFIYRQARFIEGGESQVLEDSGAQIRDGIKAMVDKGFPFEDTVPYSDDTDTTGGKIPPFAANYPHKIWGTAWHQMVKKYEAVDNNLLALKSALAAGNPVVFGFTVYESFMDIGSNGVMPIPKWSEQIIGGHCVVFMGFDEKRKVFITRNSWSPEWADKGYFYFPYKCVASLASDFWVVNAI